MANPYEGGKTLSVWHHKGNISGIVHFTKTVIDRETTMVLHALNITLAFRNAVLILKV